MYIEAKVIYNDFEGGFWGLIDNEGNQYLPVDMPQQLRYIGAIVHCNIKNSDTMSMIMWGELVEIIGFETI